MTTRSIRPPARAVELGKLLQFVRLVMVRAVKPPFTWGAEFRVQFAFIARACILPLALSSFALSFGPMGVQAAGFFETFGSFDRIGSLYELAVVREFAPVVVGIIMAGAAGTAICADLGARVVREEIAALSVLGIDPIKTLVVPRVLAMIVAAFLFNVLALIAALVGAVLVLVQHHADIAPATAVFRSNATALELQAATLKAGIFGAVIAVVSCYKGMTVSGGPEGVGRAVNQTVVIAFLAVGFIDYVFAQLLLATNPVLSQVRG